MKILRKYWPVFPALGLYLWFCYDLNVTQDDAYITFRYVANYLDGHGLVFNLGERVEGFTNFGWTILVAALGVVGLDYILWAKLLGVVFGAACIAVTYAICIESFDRNRTWMGLAVLGLVALNRSLAYWAPAGLETAAFTLFALLSVYWFLRRSWLLIFGMLMAVWIRPEGAVIAGLLILIDFRRRGQFPAISLYSSVAAFILSIPYLAYKLLYYGSILPNPFYAKTTFNLMQLQSGVEYVARFLVHYGFLGVGLLVPLLFWRKLTSPVKTIWLFAALYTVYILLIGGDVLKVHRFFLPLIGLYGILAITSLRLLLTPIIPRFAKVVILTAAIPLCYLTYSLPGEFIRKYKGNEEALIDRMDFLADKIKSNDASQFSLATTTIGRVGFELRGHRIIDMLGLTDTIIARQSEEPIPGMETTWKERKHNSKYILEQEPDYILFSTGIKPSAPAERALLLYSQFLEGYRTVGWPYSVSSDGTRGYIQSVYRRMRDVGGEIKPVYPVEFVQEYAAGLDAFNAQQFDQAIRHYDRAVAVSPESVYLYLVFQRAFALLQQRKYPESVALMDQVVAIDSTLFEPHMDLYRLAVYQGDSTKAAAHERWLKRLAPWFWPRVDSLAQQLLKTRPQNPAQPGK